MSLFDEEKILVQPSPKRRDAIDLVIAFPNTYSIGMASLGYQSAWRLFNQDENVRACRHFTDIEEKLHSKPKYLGFSFSWELDYKNIFLILEKNNIPLHAKDRGKNDPLVFAGGQVVNANPEPFCENFDFFLIGDLETISQDFLSKVVEINDFTREEKLSELAKIDGIYVPLVRNKTVKKQTTKGNLTYSSILTPNCVWPNTFIVEVVRSCPELCRFCLASYGSLPFRTPPVKESLIPIIELGLKHTNKIGLLGASITQHPQFGDLIDYLLTKNGISVQIASIRADTISKKTTEGLYKLNAKSITMAVETGSSRLREIINKKVSNETILNSIQTIYDSGFNAIKLYGMIGLPFETEDDLKQTVDFLKEVKSKNRTKKLVWSCSVFVPKATTPFQYFGVDISAQKKLKFLRKELHQIGVEFRAESYKWSLIQALISRGDRSINKTLQLAYKYGGSLGSFSKAMRELSLEIDSDYFIYKNWGKDIKLPWELIQGHLDKEVVQEHAKKHLNYRIGHANIVPILPKG